MLIGAADQLVVSRTASQALSCHRWPAVVTNDAVAGGISVAKAIGSARSCQRPSLPSSRNLYRVPAGRPGMNSSHTPEEPSERIGLARPSQPSKSPVTRTPLALGAHTANEVPATLPV